MVPVRIALEEDNARIQLGLSAVVGIQKNDSGPAVLPQVARNAPAGPSGKNETVETPPSQTAQASLNWISRTLARVGFFGAASLLAMVALGIGTPWVWHHYKQSKLASSR